MFKKWDARGFTLIELLVSVAIIALLASIVLATLSSTRARGRDARRIQNASQIERALELYYGANGQYPPRNRALSGTTDCGDGKTFGNAAWCSLKNDLAPYILLPHDPNGPQANYIYTYDADSGDNYQTYGFMLRFESSQFAHRAQNDAGFFPSTSNTTERYEIGKQPSYCMSKYSGTARDWTLPTATTVFVCRTGN